MTEQEITDKLRAKMIGDAKKDADMLYRTIGETLDDPDHILICDTINRLMNEVFARLPITQQGEIIAYIQDQAFKRFQETLTEVHKEISKENLKGAIRLCKDQERIVKYYASEITRDSDHPITFRLYQSKGEIILGQAYFPAHDEAGFPFDYLALLSLEAQAYCLDHNIEAALSCLHRAYDINPVSVDLIFLEADIHLREGNEISFRNALRKASNFICEPDYFLTYFDYLGNYYTTFHKNMKLGKALGKLKNSASYAVAIKSLTVGQKKALAKDGFAITASEDVINAFTAKARQCLNEGNRSLYTYVYSTLTNYIPADELLKQGLKNPVSAFEVKAKKPRAPRKKAVTQGLDAEIVQNNSDASGIIK